MSARSDLMRKLYDEHQLEGHGVFSRCTCGHLYSEGGRLAQVLNHHIDVAAEIGFDVALEVVMETDVIRIPDNPYRSNDE